MTKPKHPSEWEIAVGKTRNPGKHAGKVCPLTGDEFAKGSCND